MSLYKAFGFCRRVFGVILKKKFRNYFRGAIIFISWPIGDAIILSTISEVDNLVGGCDKTLFGPNALVRIHQ